MSIGLFARLEKFGIVALAKRYSSEERRPTVGKKFGFSCHQMLMKNGRTPCANGNALEIVRFLKSKRILRVDSHQKDNHL